MNQQLRRWLIVYTKPRREKKVAALLKKNGVESYCPLNEVHGLFRKRTRNSLEPLFKSYVFVRILAEQHKEIVQLADVVSFIYWLNEPAVISEEEITMIRHFVKEYKVIQTEKRAISFDSKLDETDERLLIKEVYAKQRPPAVKVLLPSLGYSMTAEVKKKVSGLSKLAQKTVEKPVEAIKL